MKADITQEALILAGSWVIGEFGDLLLKGGSYEEEELVREVSDANNDGTIEEGIYKHKQVKQSDIVDLLSTILSSAYATPIVREYILTAVMKLTTRLTEPAQIERVRRLLQSYSGDLDVEIQQRAVEYGNLFGYDQVRAGVLEKMPAPEIRETDSVMRAAPQKAKAPKKKTATAGASEEVCFF